MVKSLKNFAHKRICLTKYCLRQIQTKTNKLCLKRFRSKYRKKMSYYKETETIAINQTYLTSKNYKDFEFRRQMMIQSQNQLKKTLKRKV